MQFFLLLLFNIFMGAVLYLIISLKLERSATEFRERKLRKEMDEIIREFNATAERNISILENRIKTMKRLLEKNGDKKLLDVIIDETENPDKNERYSVQAETPDVFDTGEIQAEDSVRAQGSTQINGNGARILKKGLPLFIEKIIDILPFNKSNIAESYHNNESVTNDTALFEQAVMVAEKRNYRDRQEVSLEKDLTGVVPASGLDEVKGDQLTGEEISQLVSLSTDKYSLVSVLHERGCTIEDISHYSGIPIGEVRLVLNLNKSR